MIIMTAAIVDILLVMSGTQLASFYYEITHRVHINYPPFPVIH